ncbi:MAG: pantothenate kinase [Desulfobulbus propionicus]|nr:MAG: pantothenate kinase [Desulfobulbus propionicus]
MLFVVDVGNTHTVCGIFNGEQLLGSYRLTSELNRTTDELALRYHSLFQLQNLRPELISGCIIASVVPPLETSWYTFARRYFGNLQQDPLLVNHRMDTGITVATEYPEEVGADRIVNAVAAWQHFKDNLIVIDFGTAITFDCVDARRNYLGGTIHPGIGISLDALAMRTAKLPRVDITSRPEQVIGTTTIKAIHSGILYGFGGLVDKMVALLAREITPTARVCTVATGGMAPVIQPYTTSIDHVDQMLTLNGLQIIFNRICNHD